jgi:hypothetical protein
MGEIIKMNKNILRHTSIYAVLLSLVFLCFFPTIIGNNVKIDDSLGNESNKSSLNVEIEWIKTFGGKENDFAWSVLQTDDGGYVTAGYTESYGAGDNDVWLIKTDSFGKEEWNKTYGGMYDDYGFSIQQTNNRGFIITGYTECSNGGKFDVWLIKTDFFGVEEWNTTFGGVESDVAWDVQQTSDGGYVIVGETESYGNGNDDVWLIKTNISGNLEWNQTFGGTNEDVGNSVIQTDDGGYIIAGYTSSSGAGSKDVWLIKTNETGVEQWKKTIGGPKSEIAHAVAQTSDEGFIITGYTESYGDDHQDAWLIKTDGKGNEQWNKTFGGKAFDSGYSVIETNDGGYLLSGFISEVKEDFLLLKTDSKGNEQWNKKFGGTDVDVSRSVKQTVDGGYITAGYTKSYGEGKSDFWLIKLALENQSPNRPSRPTGETNGKAGKIYTYKTNAIEPDGDKIWFKWDWGDGTTSAWIGPYNSGDICEISHKWDIENNYNIKVKAKDNYDLESVWSEKLSVSIIYRQLWLIGFISNKTTYADRISFDTEALILVGFDPFEIRIYQKGIHVNVTKQYTGIFTNSLIFGNFKIQNIN